MPIPLCPEQFLLPPRTDGKEEERELNVSKEFQQRKKWLSSMNDLWKKEYLNQVLGFQEEVWTTQPNPLKEKEAGLDAESENMKEIFVRHYYVSKDERKKKKKKGYEKGNRLISVQSLLQVDVWLKLYSFLEHHLI